MKGKYVIIVPQEKKEAEQASVKRIAGQVLDEQGEPLIGVNVLVEGTSIGAITDMDGNFSLEAPGRQYVEYFLRGLYSEDIGKWVERTSTACNSLRIRNY